MNPTASPRRKFGWASLVALALVPLLAVAALIGLAWSSESDVKAAVVNLDEAVTVEGQLVPLGRQLAAAMIDKDGENISWTLADAPSAAAGLKSGQYSAVVTIPKGFSAAATSFSANDAATAEQATINVQVSDNSPVTDAQLAQQISNIAVDTINSTLTGSYLDGIYVGFNTVGDQFSTIVDGANQLSDGSGQLAEGTKEATQGATQLSDGMAKLKENGPKLAEGGTQLVDGITELKAGTSELASGTAELRTGVSQLNTGADQLADGVQQFADQTPQLVAGVGQLADGADQLLSQVPAFADGAAQAIGAVSQVKGGIDQFIAKVQAPAEGQDLGGLDQLTKGAEGLRDGIAGIDKAMQGYASGTTPLPGEAAGGGGAVAQGVISQFSCPEQTPDDICAAMRAGFEAGAQSTGDVAFTEGFKAGTGTASAAINTEQNGVTLLGGAEQLAAGVGTLETAIAKEAETQKGELVAGLQELRAGVEELETQAAPLVEGAPALADGATQLLDGVNQFNDQITALPAGVNQLSTGARQLADGVSELNSGVGELADGTVELDSGVGELRVGAQTYVDGVGQYVEGVGTAADGTLELTDGLVELSAGVDKLDDGVSTFASELSKGADQVPTYSQDDREKLSKVVSSPIERSDSLISSGQIPLVSLLLVAGLWLGALASFIFAHPVPRDIVTSRASSLAMWARTVWLPAAIVAGQGLLLGLVGGIVLDLGVGQTIALMALLVAFAASFVLANHALAGWLGNVGRGISMLLLVVTVALGLSSALGWLAPIGVVSPLQNGFTLVRTWLAGGSGEVGIATVSVLMFVIAATASYLAIALRRRITADQFRRAVTTAA